ncbi:uncharacterized protein NPIL_347471, partial [Nephila pilipes]
LKIPEAMLTPKCSSPEMVSSFGKIQSQCQLSANRNAFDRGSDSESEWSSLERRQREVYIKANRKLTLHKKTRKKRDIPVTSPRIPSFEEPPPPLPPLPGGQRIVTTQSLDRLEKAKLKLEQTLTSVPPQEYDSSYEVASPRDSSTTAREEIEKIRTAKKKEERKKSRKDGKQEKKEAERRRVTKATY